MTDQPISADFLSAPRRRRPRVDPTLLDWKKLTGEENVSVINRTTGKKVKLFLLIWSISLLFRIYIIVNIYNNYFLVNWDKGSTVKENWTVVT